MICYSLAPNEYLKDRASEIVGLYDGFYFVAGDWDEGLRRNVGLARGQREPGWLSLARADVEALREVGATENLLGVSFSKDGEWPSARSLLSTEFTERMRRHFASLGRAAAGGGFRGISVDLEYPYARYSLDHSIYGYENYAPGDLLMAAFHQGREALGGALEEFPEAVVFVLPGSIRSRPIDRQFMLGMLEIMAERDAPGGLHLATEYAYSLHDPVTQAAIPRFEDAGIDELLSGSALRYWRKRCTMAPGVWPLHMVETGGEGYPLRAWEEELEDLREQLKVLRAISKRYVWSYSGQPIWFVPKAGVEEGSLRGANFPRAEEVVRAWHEILREKSSVTDPGILRLMTAIQDFDEGRLNGDGLCEAFGTPGSWWVLGPLGNPHTQPERAASEALRYPISQKRIYYGRDGAVRWFPWSTKDPRGVVECRRVFDYLATDNASAHFVSWLHADGRYDAWLNIGWDDGVIVRLGDEEVFSKADYPPQGHGALYRDKYQFEERVPIRVSAGVSRLAVTTINSHMVWQFQIRITDAKGYPIRGIRFSTVTQT